MTVGWTPAPLVWERCEQGHERARGQPCAVCAEAVHAHERESAALASIPSRYRWAVRGAPELAARVKTATPIDELVEQALRAHRVVVLGPPGAGKTSLAAMLVAERRRGALFMLATTLGPARIQHPPGCGEAPDVAMALACRHLTIDDAGKERVASRVNAVPHVIFERAEADKPLLVTTGILADGRPLTDLDAHARAFAEFYGDSGIARRVFDDALVICLGGAA